MYIKILLAVAAVAMIAVLMKKKSDIDPKRAKALVAAGAKLVDVRTTGEYGDRHIEGAINIPLDQLSQRLDEFGPKSSEIVVYCRSGNRSGQAQTILKGEGFTRVHNLGPMSAWP